MSLSKQTFITIFLILIVMLTLMPFVATLNDVLTRVVIHMKGYAFIRDVIAPFEVRIVAVVLTLFGFSVAVDKEYIVLGNNTPFMAEIVWNCLGWQSLIFFIITVIVAFSGGQYTKGSKLKSIIIGLIGTFFINIFRIIAVILSFYYVGELFASIIHNYASLIVQIAWLFLFWWFSYSFVLEEKLDSQLESS